MADDEEHDGDIPPEARWPGLSDLHARLAAPRGLGRLLDNGAWVYTPAFVDSGERALQVLEGSPPGSDAHQVGQKLLERVGRQTTARNCLDALVELIAAAWLAERGVLACADEGDVIDLTLRLATRDVGVEVKSDFDAFESEIVGGSFRHDPSALTAKVRARFGGDVRVQLRWLGRRPRRDSWGPIRTRVGAAFSEAIKEAPELPADKIMTLSGRLPKPLHGCLGAEVALRRGPLVGVSAEFPHEGWEEAAERVVAHAKHKAALTEQSFFLLYVSHQWQHRTFNVERMKRLQHHFSANPGLLPGTLCGVIHLHADTQRPPSATCVVLAGSPVRPAEVERALGLTVLGRQ